MNYEDMLNRAVEKVPQDAKEGSRFSIPNALIEIQGSSTTIKNFQDIVSSLRRDPQHFLKYLSLELATSAELQNGRPVFLGRFRADQIKSKIQSYAKDFVFCSQCTKPDTHFEKKGKVTLLKCEACGAKRTVRRIK